MARYAWVYGYKVGKRTKYRYKLMAQLPDGTKKDIGKGGFDTAKDAHDERESQRVELQNDGGGLELSGNEDQPVAEFLELWVAGLAGEISTVANYQWAVQFYLAPYTRDITRRQLLNDRTGTVIATIYKRVRDGGLQGKHHQGKVASKATLTNIHKAMHAAMESMIRGTHYRNPVDRLDMRNRPGPTKRKKTAWRAEDAQRFIRGGKDHPLFAAYCLSLARGLRPQAVMGFQTDDIDFAERLLRRERFVVNDPRNGARLVKDTGKTPKSSRPVPLDDYLIQVLRRHLVMLKKWKLAAGPDWVDSPWLFVWPTSHGDWTREDGALWRPGHQAGDPIHPSTAARQFKALCVRLGLPPIRRYDLRHSFATISLRAGWDMAVVSDALDHADSAITRDLYADVEGLPAELGTRMSQMIFEEEGG